MRKINIQFLVWMYISVICVHSVGPPSRLPATVYSSPDSSGSTCPSQDTISEEHRRARDSILNSYNTAPASPCGGPGWTRVAYLDMSDTNQQCPSNWRLTTSPVRGCGRSNSGGSTCDSVTYPVNGRTYSSVCGRVIAYQKGLSYGLHNYINGLTLDQSYISGVSVTHGPAGNRTHIWSFVGAESESPSTILSYICPCTNTNVTWPYQVATYNISADYFCDTGNSRHSSDYTRYYTEDPLWDGEGCGPTSTCCSFNSPPWFYKSLPQPTSDNVEIRLCNFHNSFTEDRLISLIEVNVQ